MRRTPVGVQSPRMGAHIGMGLSLKVPSFRAMGVPVVVVRASVMESPPVAAAQRSNPPENCGKAAAAESWSHDGMASSIAAP